jgi:uncharacterized protein (TIGR03118 family)
MRYSTRNLQHTAPEGKHKRQSRKRRPAVEGLEARALLSTVHHLAVHKHFAVTVDNNANAYVTTPLVSNIGGTAQMPDMKLVEPQEINFRQDQHNNPLVWVADEGTGVATMYNISANGSTVVKSHLRVKIPPSIGSSTPSGPTGVLYNAGLSKKEFKIPGPIGRPVRSRNLRPPDTSVPAEFIFDTLQGTIEGYSPDSRVGPKSAEVVVTNNPSKTAYTGLAGGSVFGNDYIYAANKDYIYGGNVATDAPGGGIDVYNKSFQRVTFAGDDFVDKTLPAGYTPFAVHDLGAASNKQLYVTYRGPGGVGGVVAHFTNNGTFVGLIGNGVLQSPYGMDQAPQGFGRFGGDILIGNFNTGQIDAYNFGGNCQGQLDNPDGTVLTIPGLMSLHFGKGLGAGAPQIALLFTAAAPGYGLYGTITPSS